MVDPTLTWIIVATTVSALLSVTTYIAIHVTRELKNRRGLICRCYLASYIGCMIFFTISAWIYKYLDHFSSIYIWFPIALGTWYFFIASMFWLNVMSIDVWMKFREFRSGPDVDINEPRDSKFILYSIYAWGSSLADTLMFASGWTGLGSAMVMITPVIGITICNTYLFISTALMIRKWFISYVELFVMTVVNVILVPVAVFTETIFVLGLLGLLQSILTFLIFVFKDDVKRSLRQRFNQFGAIMHTLGLLLRNDSLTTVQSDDEKL